MAIWNFRGNAVVAFVIARGRVACILLAAGSGSLAIVDFHRIVVGAVCGRILMCSRRRALSALIHGLRCHIRNLKLLLVAN